MAFGIDDAIAAGLKILDKFIPDPAEKAKAAVELRTLLNQVALAQIDLNKAETQNGSFLGKWRGGLGWGLAFSIVYQLILFPFITMIALALDPNFPIDRLPGLDIATLKALLLGMLGLGG